MWNMRILLMWLLEKSEVRGIGRMGLRGRIGEGLVKKVRLRLLVWLVMPITRQVLVEKKKRAVDVQRMGREPRPGARRDEGRPASRLPEPIRARAGA